MIPISAIVPAIKANFGMLLNVVIFASSFAAGCIATRYIYLRIIEDINAEHAQVVAQHDKEKIERQNAVIIAQAKQLEAERKIEEGRKNAQSVIETMVQESEREAANLHTTIGRLRNREALDRICADTMPAAEGTSTGGDLLGAYIASVEEVRRESIEAVRQCEIERF